MEDHLSISAASRQVNGAGSRPTRINALEPCSNGSQDAGERDSTEFDAFHNTPGLLGAVGVAHLLKAECTEISEEGVLLPSTTDATAPEIWILLKVLWNRAITDDVADGDTA